MRLFLVAALCALVAGCSADGQDPSGDPQQCGETFYDYPVGINRDLDILFVVDNGPSMALEQAKLESTYRELMNVLGFLYPGMLPNIHVGVVSADMGAGTYASGSCTANGDGGVLLSGARLADCTPPSGAFISDIGNLDGTDDRNYTGELADVLACIATLGSDGCGYPQPLEAMRRALDGSVAANSGFLRPNAYLMVVFVTDKDDCSVTDPALFDASNGELGPTEFRCFEQGTVCDPDEPRVPGEKQSCRPRDDSPYLYDVQAYVDFAKQLKPDPSMVITAAIYGGDLVTVGTDGDGQPELVPACSSAVGEALPAPRLRYFLEQFPQRNTQASICGDDQTDVFAILQPVTTLGVACVHHDIDMDPDLDGLQYECVVTEIQNDGTPDRTEQRLPECETVPPEPGTLPCWYFADDPNVCYDTPNQLRFEVARGRASSTGNTHVQLRCATSMCEVTE